MGITRILILSILLTSCSADKIVERNVAALGDHPTAYKTGYGDGCYSVLVDHSPGSTEADRRRDDERMKTEPDYRLGWDDGWRKCDPGTGNIVFIKK